MLLKKQRLAKEPILTHCPGMSLKDETYYGPPDLMCGSKVKVYGRDCLIYDCDEFTKFWYVKNMGVEQKPIKLPKARENVTYQAVPEYNGFGSHEDSLANVVSPRAKAPKPDMKKMFK